MPVVLVIATEDETASMFQFITSVSHIRKKAKSVKIQLELDPAWICRLPA